MDFYPSSDQIDPDRAIFLLKNHCAILVIEDLPVGSEFGIDLVAYQVGEKFRGAKLIPPGIHFVYASAADKNTLHCGPRTGFYHNFKTNEIMIKKWSIEIEDFDDSFEPTDVHIERYRMNLEDLDRYLGVYSFSTYRTYLNLTDKLTADIVKVLEPDCGRIRSAPYLTRDASLSDQPGRRRIPRASLCSNPTEDSILPDLKPDKITLIHFTKIPDNHLESEQEISQEMITQYNLDTTMKMEQTFGNHDEGRQRLLAEFQFAFLTFLLCHVYYCFEHWKTILRLVCLADSGLSRYNSFYADFARVLIHQFDQIPEDLFGDIVSSNNLVRHLLEMFFQNLDACNNCTDDLKQSAAELRNVLETKFGWQFDLEPDDEQPCVVEL